jgi:hypothetical protein
MHLWLLIQDAWRAQSWNDKFRIWLMPTGWRPKDVEEKYPVFKIEDPYHFDKYEPVVPTSLRSWSWFQILICLLLISYLFGYIAQIGSPGIFLYGLFIFLMVYAYTELMDNHRDALYWEVAKNLLGLFILYYQWDWFGLSTLGTFLPVLLAVYFIGSTLVVYYFVRQQSRPSLTP